MFYYLPVILLISNTPLLLSLPHTTKLTNNTSYGARAANAHNPVARKLLTIMHTKQTNLAVAADVTTKAELLALADAVGAHICFLKTHIDIVQDFDRDLITQLQALAQKHNFLLVEDRKFADIGSTVQQQYTKGIYTIVEWADIVIVHALSGEDIIRALESAAQQYPHERAILLIAQLSCKGNLITDAYTSRVLEMAQQHTPFVVGFIAQDILPHANDFVWCTPGISISQQTDSLGQQYNSPDYAIKNGTDVIIVGRAIYQAKDMQKMAQNYQKIGWQSYLDRIQ